MTLQIRRGSQTDLNGIIPDLAEPIFTTDTHKLFIGDGTTAGGILVGSGALTTATTSTLGGIIVGNNLTIDGNGRLSSTGGGSSYDQNLNTTSSVTFSNLTVTNTIYATDISSTASQITVHAYNGFQVAPGTGYISAINADNISGYTGYNLNINCDLSVQGNIISSPSTSTQSNIGSSGTPFKNLYVNTATVGTLKLGAMSFSQYGTEPGDIQYIIKSNNDGDILYVQEWGGIVLNANSYGVLINQDNAEQSKLYVDKIGGIRGGDGNVHFTSTATFGKIDLGNGVMQYSTATTGITTTDPFAIVNYDTAQYATAKLSVQIKNYSAFHFAEIVVATTTVDQWLTQYGITTSDGEIGTFSVDRSGSTVTLYFTPTVGSVSITTRASVTLFA